MIISILDGLCEFVQTLNYLLKKRIKTNLNNIIVKEGFSRGNVNVLKGLKNPFKSLTAQ